MLSEPQGGHGSLSEALQGGEGQAEHQTVSARGRRGMGWGHPRRRGQREQRLRGEKEFGCVGNHKDLARVAREDQSKGN